MVVSSSFIGGEENDAALGLDDLVDDDDAFSIERELKGCDCRFRNNILRFYISYVYLLIYAKKLANIS